MNKEEYKLFDQFKSIEDSTLISDELKNVMIICNPIQKSIQYNMLKSKPQNTDQNKLN